MWGGATNEIGKTWTATYGAVGNPLTLTGPAIAASGGAQQVWTLTWSQYGTTNLWRLTQATDPSNRWTQYQYNATVDPTLITKVIEMPDGVSGSLSNSNGETNIEHYDSSMANARGQLKLVVDANGVNHKFWYNEWGYQSATKEGGILSMGPGDPVGGVDMNCGTDEAGQTTNSVGDESCTASTTYSADGAVVSQLCVCSMGTQMPARYGNVPSPPWSAESQCLESAGYNLRQQALDLKRGCSIELSVTPVSSGFETQRRHEFDYDAIGRPVRTKHISDIDDTSPGTVNRESWFSYLKAGSLPEPAGVTVLTGPDGQSTTATYDDLGRPSIVQGGSSGDMQSETHYDQAGRVDWVRRGILPNGSKTLCVYDEVNRVTEIRVESLASVIRYQTVYAWNLNNTVASRSEVDNFAGMSCTVSFTYDNRDRLIGEMRVQGTTTVYDFDYGYDQLGNRTHKADSVALKWTDYFYDTVSGNREPNFPTLNNRLMKYEEKINGTLVRTVKYTYYKTGDASNIVIKDHYVNSTLTPGAQADYDWSHDLALYYFTNGSLRLALSDKWKLDTNGDPDSNTYTALSAREFRFDSGRARYLFADYNCNGSTTTSNWTLTGGAVDYTDYIGDAPYSDAAIASNGSGGHAFTANTRYYGLSGRQTLDGTGAVTNTRYFHGDLIASNVLATDPNGAAVASTAFTAFGDKVPASAASPDAADPSTLGMRYQYAGGIGYESGAIVRTGVNSTLVAITLAHVGARWYDATIGRFSQRDPMGLAAGRNVYEYVANCPPGLVDPTGLCFWGPDDPTYGLPKKFWNWAHRQPGFSDLKGPNGNISFDDALEMFDEWLAKNKPNIRGGPTCGGGGGGGGRGGGGGGGGLGKFLGVLGAAISLADRCEAPEIDHNLIFEVNEYHRKLFRSQWIQFMCMGIPLRV